MRSAMLGTLSLLAATLAASPALADHCRHRHGRGGAHYGAYDHGHRHGRHWCVASRKVTRDGAADACVLVADAAGRRFCE